MRTVCAHRPELRRRRAAPARLPLANRGALRKQCAGKPAARSAHRRARARDCAARYRSGSSSWTSLLSMARMIFDPAQRVSAGHEDSVMFGSAELNG